MAGRCALAKRCTGEAAGPTAHPSGLQDPERRRLLPVAVRGSGRLGGMALTCMVLAAMLARVCVRVPYVSCGCNLIHAPAPEFLPLSSLSACASPPRS